MRIIAGISGCCVIDHKWRFDKSDLTPIYSPHKHLICFGWIKKNASELIKEQLGIDVIYHKVRNGTLRNRVDVFAVAFYQLSHCAVNHRKHSLQWFGDLANNKLSNNPVGKTGAATCPFARTRHLAGNCGTPWCLMSTID